MLLNIHSRKESRTWMEAFDSQSCYFLGRTYYLYHINNRRDEGIATYAIQFLRINTYEAKVNFTLVLLTQTVAFRLLCPIWDYRRDVCIYRFVSSQGGTVPEGPEPADNIDRTITLILPVVVDNTPFGQSFGNVVEQPPTVARRGETVSATFVSTRDHKTVQKSIK